MFPLAGPRGRVISRLEASSTASVCCNHQNQLSKCNNKICNSDWLNLEQLVKARETGVLDLSPEDEVEGEIVYFQHRLLSNAAARKPFTGLFFVLLTFSEYFGLSIIHKFFYLFFWFLSQGARVIVIFLMYDTLCMTGLCR